jgi:FG-GAP-like repeat
MTRTFALPCRFFSVVALLVLSALIVVAQNPVPFLSQPLVPDAMAPAPPGGPIFTRTLTVNGTGFVRGSTVNWNGSPRTTAFVNHSRLVAFIRSSDIARPTTAWISVTNPSPGGGTSNTLWLPVNHPEHSLSFERTDYPVGTMPAFSTAFDVDGDGILDLAVPTNNDGEGQVLFMLGNGDGTFRYGDTYQMGWGTVKPILADFNRDGILDCALAVHSPSAMAVLLGTGHGNFGSPIYYATGAAPTWDIAADFNKDGKLDLATVNATGYSVSILLGNGDGTFQPHVDYPLGSYPTALAAGDFNGDGNLDLVVANYGASAASVLLGNGDGTFRPPVNYPAGPYAGRVAVADLNGDGKLDIVIANQGEARVSVLLGNGDGTFRPQVKYPTTAPGIGLDIADMNDDGKIDLVVATDDNTVNVVLGNGDGTFQAPVSFPVATEPFDSSAADFNRDGRMDIVTSSYGENSISVLIQQPAALPVSPVKPR